VQNLCDTIIFRHRPVLDATSIAAPVVMVPPPSMLRGKTIEEIVNRWSTDLENHVREFNKFAGEVAVWDRALIENGNNVSIIMTTGSKFI
jgi:nuclear pore complex protein Nup62